MKKIISPPPGHVPPRSLMQKIPLTAVYLVQEGQHFVSLFHGDIRVCVCRIWWKFRTLAGHTAAFIDLNFTFFAYLGWGWFIGSIGVEKPKKSPKGTELAFTRPVFKAKGCPSGKSCVLKSFKYCFVFVLELETALMPKKAAAYFFDHLHVAWNSLEQRIVSKKSFYLSTIYTDSICWLLVTACKYISLRSKGTHCV